MSFLFFPVPLFSYCPPAWSDERIVFEQWAEEAVTHRFSSTKPLTTWLLGEAVCVRHVVNIDIVSHCTSERWQTLHNGGRTPGTGSCRRTVDMAEIPIVWISKHAMLGLVRRCSAGGLRGVYRVAGMDGG